MRKLPYPTNAYANFKQILYAFPKHSKSIYFLSA